MARAVPPPNVAIPSPPQVRPLDFSAQERAVGGLGRALQSGAKLAGNIFDAWTTQEFIKKGRDELNSNFSKEAGAARGFEVRPGTSKEQFALYTSNFMDAMRQFDGFKKDHPTYNITKPSWTLTDANNYKTLVQGERTKAQELKRKKAAFTKTDQFFEEGKPEFRGEAAALGTETFEQPAVRARVATLPRKPAPPRPPSPGTRTPISRATTFAQAQKEKEQDNLNTASGKNDVTGMLESLVNQQAWDESTAKFTTGDDEADAKKIKTSLLKTDGKRFAVRSIKQLSRLLINKPPNFYPDAETAERDLVIASPFFNTMEEFRDATIKFGAEQPFIPRREEGQEGSGESFLGGFVRAPGRLGARIGQALAGGTEPQAAPPPSPPPSPTTAKIPNTIRNPTEREAAILEFLREKPNDPRFDQTIEKLRRAGLF